MPGCGPLLRLRRTVSHHPALLRLRLRLLLPARIDLGAHVRELAERTYFDSHLENDPFSEHRVRSTFDQKS